MTEDRVELVRRGYDAWNGGDRSWVLEHMSPEVEWVTPSEDLDRGTYTGYAGVEEFWGQWRASVGQLGMQVEELSGHGDHVVAVVRRSGRGEHSGLEVSDRVVQVFSFAGDKCVRVSEHYEKADALREIGASELAEQ